MFHKYFEKLLFRYNVIVQLNQQTNHFLFNDCLYEQTNAVAMSSPLGPLLSNMFLAFHERCWYANCPAGFKPLFFRVILMIVLLLFAPVITFVPF